MSERNGRASNSGAPPPTADLLAELLPLRRAYPADLPPGSPQSTKLLAGDGLDELPAFEIHPLANAPDGFEPSQRDAVAAALSTPDLCVIQGSADTIPVAVEVVSRAAATGRRILLLAPTASVVDRLLESVAPRVDLCGIRCTEPGEETSALPSAVRQYLSAERVQQVQEALRHRLAEVRGRQSSLESRLVEVEASTRAARSNAQQLSTAAARLGPLAEALAARRWWTLGYWRARGMPDLAMRLAKLNAQLESSRQAERTSLEEETRLRREAAEESARAAGLESSGAIVSDRLAQCADLVAGTPAALTGNHMLAPEGRRFDLLVVVESQEIGEANLLAAAARADRWVLLGQPAQPTGPQANGCHAPETPFHALWQRLYVEPWGPENSRFLARLRHVPSCERGRLSVEPVADRPDIELRILEDRNQMPQLAEVAFPSGTTAEQARSYLIEQLGESPSAARAVRLAARTS